jgi:hypothetical protein
MRQNAVPASRPAAEMTLPQRCSCSKGDHSGYDAQSAMVVDARPRLRRGRSRARGEQASDCVYSNCWICFQTALERQNHQEQPTSRKGHVSSEQSLFQATAAAATLRMYSTEIVSIVSGAQHHRKLLRPSANRSRPTRCFCSRRGSPW